MQQLAKNEVAPSELCPVGVMSFKYWQASQLNGIKDQCMWVISICI